MATIIFISCVWIVFKLTKAAIKSIPRLFRLAWIIITKPIISLWDLLGIVAARRWNDTDTDTDTDTERQDINALKAQRNIIKAEIRRLESETDDSNTDAETDLNAEIMRLEKQIKSARGLEKTRLENELAALQVEIFCKDTANKPKGKRKATSADPGKQINQIIGLYGKLAAVESKLNKAQSPV